MCWRCTRYSKKKVYRVKKTDIAGLVVQAGLVPIINLLKIIPISTAEDDGFFLEINMMYTDFKS